MGLRAMTDEEKAEFRSDRDAQRDVRKARQMMIWKRAKLN
jgi:hypothetical protein